MKIKIDDNTEMTLDEVSALGNAIIKEKIDKIKNKFKGWYNAKKIKTKNKKNF